MLNDLYASSLLDLATNISRQGRLSAPHASATARSKLCGSQITVDLTIDDGRVSDFAQEVDACALGRTSAAIMARHIVGSTPDELRSLDTAMRKMLRGEGEPPSGKWADLKILTSVRPYKERHASTLLVFEAVVRALDGLPLE